MSKVLHVAATHPLNQLDPALRARFVQAQTEMIDMEFRTAGELLLRVFDDLKLNITAPPATMTQPVNTVADLNYRSLVPFFTDILRANRVPDQANRRQAANLAHRVQLLRAFKDPDRYHRRRIQLCAFDSQLGVSTAIRGRATDAPALPGVRCSMSSPWCINERCHSGALRRHRYGVSVAGA